MLFKARVRDFKESPSSGFLAVGTRKDFGVFRTNQWLCGTAARSEECFSEDSSETSNF
jgi:hypothetical protein